MDKTKKNMPYQYKNGWMVADEIPIEPAITNNCELLGEHNDYGFTIVEPDDHITQLYFKDKLIATYNQAKVTPEIIREECHNYIEVA